MLFVVYTWFDLFTYVYPIILLSQENYVLMYILWQTLIMSQLAVENISTFSYLCVLCTYIVGQVVCDMQGRS